MEEAQPTELPREGEDISTLEPDENKEAQVNDTPAESSTDSNENGEAPSQEGAPSTPDDTNVPFHQHPRWKEMHEKLTSAEQRADQMSQYMQNIPGYLDEMRKQLTNKDAPVPDWFKTLYGDNPEAYKLYQQQHDQEIQQVRQQVLGEIQENEKKQRDSQAYWARQVNEEFEKLEQAGKQFDREELKTVLMTYRPTNENGLLDFGKAYEILDNQKKAAVAAGQNQQRKRIADTTSPTPGGDTPAKDYQTTADLRNKTWHSL